MINDEKKILDEPNNLWDDSSLDSSEKLNEEFSSRVIEKSQKRTVFKDFIFMIVVGFKEMMIGFLPKKSSQKTGESI